MADPLWISMRTGERSGSLLRNPKPLHGRASSMGKPTHVDARGRLVRVAEVLDHWNIHNDLGHQSICAAGWAVQLADGSRWLVVRDLIAGGWVGEPLPSPLPGGH
jgi:hypothetical protein